ncbi:MAG: SDR family NAD(P)-dependent oxidoreductase [Candidatus Dadabacteria bacterium]|nr:SDR family NAD(P)-dependent oxidoreductase [Candidatus Dadabacteria bacterium]NIQ14948.1 SDR family NAD(P)-dependent oxidoreductase [Candidatus Dadabacteria bacterium]
MNKKVAVITGASRGIGRAIALELAKDNYFLALCSRNKKNLEKLGSELKQINDSFILSSFDIREENKVAQFIREIVKKADNINILINNAGIASVSKIEDTEVDNWDEIIDTNLKSTFLMVKHCLPNMSDGDQIINIGSNASKIGFPNWSAYCASKFGVLGFTNALREEVRGRGIRVSAVLPGPTKTDIWENLDGNWNKDIMMNPEIIAKTVLSVINQPDGANIDEIDIVPTVGKL